MEPAILTGLFALGGVLIGAFLTFLFQRRNWLYQMKVEAFSTLLEKIEISRHQSLNYAFNPTYSKEQIKDYIQDQFIPVLVQEKKARLLSHEGTRKSLDDIVYGFQAALNGDIESVPSKGLKHYISTTK